MATKTIQAKNELFSKIWKAATQVKHWKWISSQQFMAYFLWMLFYRFISENITEYVNKQQHEAGEIDFDYTKMSDADAEEWKDIIVQEKWFFIKPSQLFQNVVKHCSTDEDYNTILHNIFRAIENSAQWTESESDVKGLFDDFNVSSQVLWTTVEERNKILSYLTHTVDELDLWEHDIDVFGDAYEYLIGMYAADAGKWGWEFFTPQEVSELLVKITTHWVTQVNKVYDPACWSGWLLLKFKKVLWDNWIKQWYFGQEINVTTYNLCRINMFLHNVNYEKFDIARWDTLINPKHWDDEPFDIIVSNPPYAVPREWDGNPLLINDPRFAPAGVLAPQSKGDFAFVMHIVSWLSAQWTWAIIEFPWTLYRKWAEQKIRKYLVDNNFIDTIIQLPTDLFFGTSIATCIYVIKKNKKNTDILFIDAGKEFIHVWNRNQLSEENQNNIFNYYINREDIDHMCKVVDYDTIKENDYNLSVSTYVEAEDTREAIDIDNLNRKIADIVERENKLRCEIDKIIQENF